MEMYSLSVIAPVSYVIDNPHVLWSKEGLSRNKGMTIDYVIKYPSDDYYDGPLEVVPASKWDWVSLSKMMPIHDIRNNPHLPWTKEGLSYNNGSTLDDILYLDISGGDYDWQHLSQILPIKEIMYRLDLPWDRDGLSWNIGITIGYVHDIDRYLDSDTQWDWDAIVQVVPMSELVKAIEDNSLPEMICRQSISNNPGLTIGAIKRIDKYLDWDYLWDWEAMAKVVPMSDILDYVVHLWQSDIPIGWYELSIVVPISYVCDHSHMPWDREGLSKNKDISIRYIDYLDKHSALSIGRWKWPYLQMVLPIQDMIHGQDISLDRYYLSQNKGITLDIISQAVGSGRWLTSALARTLPISDILKTIEDDTHTLFIWNRRDISYNPSLTMDAIKRIDQVGVDGRWYWIPIAKVVPVDDIMAYAIPLL